MRRSIGLLPLALILAAPAEAQRTPTMRELIELSDLSSVAISPDGRMAAFREESASIERNAHDLAWFVVPVDGSAPPRRLADAGEGNWLNGTLLSEPPLWSEDSRFIFYRAVIDGEVQLWRAGADTAGNRGSRDCSCRAGRRGPVPDRRLLMYCGMPGPGDCECSRC